MCVIPVVSIKYVTISLYYSNLKSCSCSCIISFHIFLNVKPDDSCLVQPKPVAVWMAVIKCWVSTESFVVTYLDNLHCEGKVFCCIICIKVGYAVAQRHCATSWKVAGSIPDGVIEIFQ